MLSERKEMASNKAGGIRGKVWTSSKGQQGVLKGSNSGMTSLHFVEDPRERPGRWQGEHGGGYCGNVGKGIKDGSRNSCSRSRAGDKT